MRTRNGRLAVHPGLAGVAGAAVLTLAASSSAPAAVTEVEEVVMYAVNNDGNPATFMRYAFDSEDPIEICDVQDASGVNYKDVECLTYIPEGPNQGFYGAHNYDGQAKSRIIKIDPMDDGAAATPLPNYVGFGYVVGMVAWEKPTGGWVILATHFGQINQSGSNKKNLLEIDPATGKGKVVGTLTKIHEGLARDSSGVLYSVSDGSTSQVWTITPPLVVGEPATETLVGTLDQSKVESLEFAFGDYQPKIQVPGMPSAWGQNGILFAYSDQANGFLVINPQIGQPGGKAVVYTPSFQLTMVTSDVEGIVFFTRRTDPLRPILVGD